MFNKIKSIITAGVAGLLVSVLALTPVFANDNQVSLQLSPPSERIVLDPLPEHNNLERNLTLTNNGGRDIKVYVYAGPYSAKTNENGEYAASFSTETARTQLSRWITFKEASGEFKERIEVPIAKGEKKDVTYKISVPESIPAGGQYATIFAEVAPSESSGISAVPRPSLVIYGVAKGETKMEAKIAEYNFPTFIISGKIAASSKVENTGNTDITVSQELVVKNLFGATLFNRTVNLPVLPETDRKFSGLVYEDTPMFGFFWATYKVSIPETGQVEGPTKLIIVIPVFLLILFLILLTIFVAWLILFIKQRKERRSRVIN